MHVEKNIDVIIPAFNEESSISKVIQEIPAFVREIIVVDNNSQDNTSENALSAGTTVLKEKRQGYGSACLKGMEYLKNKNNPPDIVVFLDGDYSDFPQEMSNIIAPILEENMDMVIGSRTLGNKEKGSMMPQQVFGNWLATSLLRIFMVPGLPIWALFGQ